ncbi:proton channel OTOP2-like [Ptychodera flava]|uniref:proton channel OTOP2-like n=1 Tax=Ptychodera flava TaxID=63121 RepID=UPI003969BB6C
MAVRKQWLVSPLITGRGSSVARRDGRVSSILFACNLVTVAFVLMITQLMSGRPGSFVNEVTAGHVQILISIMLVFATSFMMWFIIRGSRYSLWLLEDKSHDGQSQAHFTLDLLGVYIFGTGKIVLELLEMFAALECVAMADHLDNMADYVTSVVFYALRLVFQVTEMLFLGKFSRATLHNSVVIRYSLLLVLSVNLMLWFFTLAAESEELLSRPQFSRSMHEIYSANETATLTLIEQCINHTTKWQVKMKTVDHILFPFCLEYSLVAVNILYHIWISMKFLKSARGRGKRDFRQEGKEKSPGFVNITGDHGFSGLFLDTEKSSILAKYEEHVTQGEQDSSNLVHGEKNISDSSNCSSIESANYRSGDRTPTQQNMVMPQCGSVGSLAGIFLMIVMVLMSALQQQHFMQSKIEYAYYATKIVYFSIMSALCWVGFELIATQDYEHRPYGGDDSLLVITVIGVFGFIYFKAFSAIGVIMYPHGGNVWSARFLLVEKLINGVELWLQTTFLIAASRYHPRCKRKGAKVQGLVLCLLFCNLGLWSKASFIDQFDHYLSSVEIEVYSLPNQWALIMKVLLPFCIFYRFHSVIMCCGIYVRFREQPRYDETDCCTSDEESPILTVQNAQSTNCKDYESIQKTT